MPIRLPWSIDVALTAVVFYGVGYSLRGKNMSFPRNKSGKFILLFCLLLVSIIFCFLNGQSDMNSNKYNNIVFFYITAFAGIFFYLMISKMLRKSVLLDYVGRNTIIILGLSGVSLFILRGIFYLTFNQFPDVSNISIEMGIILSCFQILFLVPVMYMINIHCPFILGREFRKTKKGGQC